MIRDQHNGSDSGRMAAKLSQGACRLQSRNLLALPVVGLGDI